MTADLLTYSFVAMLVCLGSAFVVYGINGKLGTKQPPGLPRNFGFRDFYDNMKRRGMVAVFWVYIVLWSVLFVTSLSGWAFVILGP